MSGILCAGLRRARKNRRPIICDGIIQYWSTQPKRITIDTPRGLRDVAPERASTNRHLDQ